MSTTGKHVVAISRDWHHPTISIDVTDRSIGISMPLTDFVKALAAEIGKPTLILTQAQLLSKMQLATETIVTSMKHETTPVV